MSGQGPVLVAFAGLPGVGKTSLAKALCEASGAVYLRVDSVEQALRTEAASEVGAAGYRVLYALAADNLACGLDVVTDTVNPLAETREAFAACARQAGARHIDVEVVCSDRIEHRRRVETRRADVPGLTLPDWDAVMNRTTAPWTTPRIVLDTARRSVGEAVGVLLAQIEG